MKQKTKSATSVKQKVVAAVAVVAIAAGAMGILSAIGRSKGYGFGYPFIRTAPKTSPIVIKTKPIIKTTVVNTSYGSTLSMSLSPDTPASKYVLADATNNELTKLVFTATKESFVIDKLRVLQRGTADEYKQVIIQYRNAANVTKTFKKVAVNGIVDFSGLDIFVSNNISATVSLKADMNTIAAGADNGHPVALGVDTSGANFHAIGKTSGMVINDAPGNVIINGKTHTLYSGVPIIKFNSVTPNGNLIPSSNTLVGVFSVNNPGSDNVTFDGATGSNGLNPNDTFNFSVIGTRQMADNNQETWTLKDQNGTVLDTVTADIFGDANKEIVFKFMKGDFVVGPGQLKKLMVYTDTTELKNDGDSLQLWLNNKPKGTPTSWSINYDNGNYINTWATIPIYGGTIVK